MSDCFVVISFGPTVALLSLVDHADYSAKLRIEGTIISSSTRVLYAREKIERRSVRAHCQEIERRSFFRSSFWI